MALPERDFSAAIDDHGGDLARAARLFPHAPRPFLDLSTGINPHAYPLFELPATALTRLPEPARLASLREAAAAAYRAPSAANVVAAPGTQILLPRVATLVAPGRAAVLSPTYAEHARAAALAGHRVRDASALDKLAEADLAVVVNPNNPDGRLTARDDLLSLAERLRARGSLLVVDEAFMEASPRDESLAGDVESGGLVVLRSFGKFFGLAGVRLGFAVAERRIAERLAAELGPWAVAGQALEYGLTALRDAPWRAAMRERLAIEAARLDGLLARFGVAVAGGTHLFRHVRLADAQALFEALGRRGVLVRRFAERPTELRFGLPGAQADWDRLETALREWQEGSDRAGFGQEQLAAAGEREGASQ